MTEDRKVASFGLRKVGWMLCGLPQLSLPSAALPGVACCTLALQAVPKAGVWTCLLLCACGDLSPSFSYQGASLLWYELVGVGRTLRALCSM